VSGARPRVLAGTFAAVLALGAGRWGAYIGKPPLFLTDILVFAACARLIWENERVPGRRTAPVRIAPFLILLGWSFLRFIGGGQLNLTALRDAVPYFYAVLGVVSALAWARSTTAQRERTARVLVWALGLHAAWVFVDELIMPSLSARLPVVSRTQGLHVLSIRPDFDVAIAGAFAAYLLSRVLRTGLTWRLGVGLAVALGAVVATDKRSGILGAAVPLAAVAWGGLRHWRISYQARMSIAGFLALSVAAIALLLPSTVAGQRLLSSVGLSSANAAHGVNSVATQNARERAWGSVERYSEAQPARFLAGVGFGPDFMTQSGALVELVGPAAGTSPGTDPRSPHSWWIGTQARLGVIGLGVVVVLAFMLLRQIGALYEVSRQSDELPLIGLLVVLSLIVPLSLGVIMEAPFGAVPFFWCAGIVLNRRVRPIDDVAHATL